MRAWVRRIGLVSAAGTTALVACGRSGIEGPAPGAVPPFGRGTDGTLVVDDTLVVNECWPILESGASSIVIAGAPTSGRMLLLHQTQDSGAATGDTAALTTVNPPKDGGQFDLLTIAALDTTSRAPFFQVVFPRSIEAFSTGTSGRRAQACVVPEYDDLTITPDGMIVAEPWDGDTGGIVAFYVRGTLVNDGGVSASARGFRGGQTRGDDSSFGVTELDLAAGIGAGKGEGLDGRSHALSGKGNYWNAGGGGNAHNAGGGGGGGWGAGGAGAMQPDNLEYVPATAGVGGAAARVDDRLMIGGGGGAGHENENEASNGANGGGIVIVFAAQVIGSAGIGASGGAADLSSDDGAGGGGGGGTIWLRSDGATYNGTIAARGGRGGDTTFSGVCLGNGGGGGGGRIILDGINAPGADVSAGTNGVCTNSGNATNGALPGAAGVIETR